MEVIPRDILSRQKFPDNGGHFLPDIGLQRFLIVVMFELCRRPRRLLSGRSKRITFESRQRYSLLRFLIPSSHARCMCPTIFRFEEACCGIESEPIVISCRGSERFRMNFVHHDVDMEMPFVVVSDDHILMVFISKRFQCL